MGEIQIAEGAVAEHHDLTAYLNDPTNNNDATDNNYRHRCN
jgi:hypothetical protein